MGKGKRGRPSKKEQKTITNDMLGGFLVVFGLILAVFISFKNVGDFAQICKVVFLGALGKSAYTFPLLLMGVGTYCIMSEKKVNSLSQIRKGLIVIALIAATLTVFTESSIAIYSNPIKAIVDSVNEGIANQNYGGAIGTLLGGALAGIIGMVPSRIIFPLLTFVVTLFVYNISFKQFFGAVSYGFNYTVDHLNNVINTLFRDDEVKKYEYVDELGNPKLSRREKARLKKEKLKQEKLKEPGSSNVEENLNLDKSEQIEFDFSKLGGQPSEAEIKGKQKRDEFFKQQKEEKEDKSVKEVLTLDHTAHVEDDNYIFPSIDLLAKPKASESFDKKAIHSVAVRLQTTLASFKVDAKVTNITKGPTVTRY